MDLGEVYSVHTASEKDRIYIDSDKGSLRLLAGCKRKLKKALMIKKKLHVLCAKDGKARNGYSKVNLDFDKSFSPGIISKF